MGCYAGDRCNIRICGKNTGYSFLYTRFLSFSKVKQNVKAKDSATYLVI